MPYGRSLRHLARRALQRHGLDVSRWEPRSPDQIFLSQAIAELRINHVIDVGANVGQYGRLLRTTLGFRGRIDSYEPGQAAYTTLDKAASDDPSWITHRTALTDSNGPLELNVYESSDLSSLSSPSAVGRSAWVADWDGRAEQVQGRCLADEDLPDLGPTFLKVDTQGHDWNVIAGAGAVLDRVEMLMTELSFVPLYESSVPAWDVLSQLNERGYVLASLTPVNRVIGSMVLLEADGVFVKHASGRNTWA